MKELTIKEAELLGIKMKNHQMDNGEKRFRLIQDSGSSYICTVSSDESGWQNSHVHNKKKEVYLVEKGCILVAKLMNDKVEIQKLYPDEMVSMSIGVPHNIYMCANTVLHTIKYGTSEEDWNACVELDEKLILINLSGYM